MKIIKVTLAVIVAIIATGLFTTWTQYHDEQVAEASKRYEDCVSKKFETTPGAYYYSHGHYPTCK